MRVIVPRKGNFGYGKKVYSRPGIMEVQVFGTKKDQGEAKKCHCENGEGAEQSPVTCKNDINLNFCSKCDDGYYLNEVDNSCLRKDISCLERMWNSVQDLNGLTLSYNHESNKLEIATIDEEKYRSYRSVKFSDLSIFEYEVSMDNSVVANQPESRMITIGWTPYSKTCESAAKNIDDMPGLCQDNNFGSKNTGFGYESAGRIWIEGKVSRNKVLRNIPSFTNANDDYRIVSKIEKKWPKNSEWAEDEMPEINYKIYDDSQGENADLLVPISKKDLKRVAVPEKWRSQMVPNVALSSINGGQKIYIKSAKCFDDESEQVGPTEMSD